MDGTVVENKDDRPPGLPGLRAADPANARNAARCSALATNEDRPDMLPTLRHPDKAGNDSFALPTPATITAPLAPVL